MTPLFGVAIGSRPLIEAVIITAAVAGVAVFVNRLRRVGMRRRRRGPEIQWMGGRSAGEHSGTSQVSDVVDSAKQKAQEQVGEVAEKGRGVVRDQVDRRSTQAGEQARGVAKTLRQTAAQARGEGNDQQARLAEQGADRLDRLGGYLTDADGDEILWRVEDVARRQPLLVAGAGLFWGSRLRGS